MHFLKSLLPYTLFLSTTRSVPVSPPDSLAVPRLDSRQTCLDTCGSICYWANTVADAQTKGYDLLASGDDINSYPHQYNNRENLDFPVSGPYYEYPILRSFNVYTGGSPGADRVIFNGADQYAGLITHQGADGNEFVECV